MFTSCCKSPRDGNKEIRRLLYGFDLSSEATGHTKLKLSRPIHWAVEVSNCDCVMAMKPDCHNFGCRLLTLLPNEKDHGGP